MGNKYDRNLEELQEVACKWWPKEVRDEANKLSIMGFLLETQDKFISILNLIDPLKYQTIFDIIRASNFNFKLFLKHLIVLTDFGSEPLQRVNKSFKSVFPSGKMEYSLPSSNQIYEYKFQKLPVKGSLNNAKMRVDTKENITSQKVDTQLCEDIIMLLMYGAACTSAEAAAILFKCTPYTYLGNKNEIRKFVKGNYIRVSRIIAGKTSTDMGNVAQSLAVDYIAQQLGPDYCVKSNGTIPGVTENDGVTLATFDIVVDRSDDTSRHKPYVGVEISFQETTNSVIERKATLSRNRFEKVSGRRSYVGYILDGVGNFARAAAARTICENSHCTVAYTKPELNHLIEFIKEKLG